MKVWLNWQQYYDFCKQAVKNDGRVIIEAPGFSRTEIMMDVEYAKRVCAEVERIADAFNAIGSCTVL